MRHRLWMGLGLSVLLGGASHATNGGDLTAHGVRSEGMGGADVAATLDATCINTNPAGITRHKRRFDFGFGIGFPSSSFSDSITTPMGTMPIAQNIPGTSPNGGITGQAAFVTPLSKNWSLGLGVFTQGGGSGQYENVPGLFDDNAMTQGPPRPGVYNVNGNSYYLKVAPAIAYRFRNLGGVMDLSFGAAPSIGFYTNTFEHTALPFPEPDGDRVFVPHHVNYNSNTGIVFGGHFGAHASFWQERLMLGATYRTPSPVSLDGSTTLDNAIHYDAHVEFDWPQMAGFGIAGRPWQRLLLSTDLRWINWSTTQTVTIQNHTSNAPPALQSLPLALYPRFRDQYVVAFGAEVDVTHWLAVRAGWNWAQAAQGPDGFSPTLVAIAEHHIGFGLSGKLGDHLVLHTALLIIPSNTVTSDANNQTAFVPGTMMPNGYRMTVRTSTVVAFAGLGYEF